MHGAKVKNLFISFNFHTKNVCIMAYHVCRRAFFFGMICRTLRCVILGGGTLKVIVLNSEGQKATP